MRTRLLVGLLTAVAVSMLWFFGPRTIKDSLEPEWKTRSEPQSAPIQVAMPREVDVVQGIGYVEPVSEVCRLAFKCDGVVDAVLVEIGQIVNKGDVIRIVTGNGGGTGNGGNPGGPGDPGSGPGAGGAGTPAQALSDGGSCPPGIYMPRSCSTAASGVCCIGTRSR